MIRTLAVVGSLVLAAWLWIYMDVRARRAARALDEAIAQAQAMSAHPSMQGIRRWGGGPVPAEDSPDWPGAAA